MAAGKADARKHGMQAVNPYAPESEHGCAWEVGYCNELEAMRDEASPGRHGAAA
ncbi:hypothetical protein [Cupriavidus basilensis]|uniref:hypothetical protein n=1 Tax=Cupriavidus basilensis TaxID=68895 RepID=UPI002840069C|nr:hypothetical protein [Cupriavidus basilensis]MDR3382294.1 hypothetical protein [Cupriavidus basilensis]